MRSDDVLRARPRKLEFLLDIFTAELSHRELSYVICNLQSAAHLSFGQLKLADRITQSVNQ